MEKLYTLEYKVDYDKDLQYEDFKKLYFFKRSRKSIYIEKSIIFLLIFIVWIIRIQEIFKWSYCIGGGLVWFTLTFIFESQIKISMILGDYRSRFSKLSRDWGINLFEDYMEVISNSRVYSKAKYMPIIETDNLIFIASKYYIPKNKISKNELFIFRKIAKNKTDYIILGKSKRGSSFV